MNTEKPTVPLLDLPGSERLKANRERTAEQHTAVDARTRRLNYVTGLIAGDVAAAPMSYISDGGDRAARTAERIERMYERTTLDRIADVLTALELAVTDAQRSAQEQASHAHARGRVAAYQGVLDATALLRAAVTAPASSGRTRQENAQAFAETIITGTTNQTGADK